MKTPRRGRSAQGKRVPCMRFKLDGSWWKVKVQRPPAKEVCEGLCDFSAKTIFLHPKAVSANGIGIVVHECAHAVLPAIDEDHVLELERIVSAVARFTARLRGGNISVGKHSRVA